jgi:hypothetical protein
MQKMDKKYAFSFIFVLDPNHFSLKATQTLWNVAESLENYPPPSDWDDITPSP